jgi:hypothetical protein
MPDRPLRTKTSSGAGSSRPGSPDGMPVSSPQVPLQSPALERNFPVGRCRVARHDAHALTMTGRPVLRKSFMA